MAHSSSPVIGAQGSAYLEPDHWQFDFGWRYQYSYQHFTGSHQDARDSSEVKNTINILNFGLTYGWSDQQSFSLLVPYVINTRSSADTYRTGPGNEDIEHYSGSRNYTFARGIGDASIWTHRWLLDVHDNQDQNIAVGIGLKLPTGDPEVVNQTAVRDTKGTAGDSSDDVISYPARPVDSSIQPGNGGWGIPIDLSAFKQFGIFTPYAFGSYLFSPEGTNNVLNGASNTSTGSGNRINNPKSKYMTIADEYLARLGTMMAVPELDGVSVGFGGRIEGVPSHDLIGPDTGFRRPGFAISIEPSLVYALGNDVVSVAVAIPVYRNRIRSVPDQYAGTHGDAAFANYVIMFGWSHRF